MRVASQPDPIAHLNRAASVALMHKAGGAGEMAEGQTVFTGYASSKNLPDVSVMFDCLHVV